MLDSTTNCGVGALVEISIICVQEARISAKVIAEKKLFKFVKFIFFVSRYWFRVLRASPLLALRALLIIIEKTFDL
jgi:hypothetical protein